MCPKRYEMRDLRKSYFGSASRRNDRTAETRSAQREEENTIRRYR
jgi:hypothetical protein